MSTTAGELWQPSRTVYHIGHHKTGTTALQNTLRDAYCPSRSAITDTLYPNVAHPQSGGREPDANHNSIHYLYARPGHAWVTETPRDVALGIVSAVNRHRPETLILSAEDAFFLGQRPRPEQELAFLDAIVPYQKEYVAFLRRPDLYAASWQKQLLRFGSKAAPLHNRRRVRKLLNSCIFDYRMALEPYVEQNANVRVLRYADGTDSVATFFEQILDKPAPATSSTANASIPDIFAELARDFTVNHRRLTHREIRRLIRFGRRRHRRGVDMFGEVNRQRIRKHFEASNEWLIDTFGAEAGFDDLDAIVDIPDDWLTPSQAASTYRKAFNRLVDLPGEDGSSADDTDEADAADDDSADDAALEEAEAATD